MSILSEILKRINNVEGIKIFSPSKQQLIDATHEEILICNGIAYAQCYDKKGWVGNDREPNITKRTVKDILLQIQNL